MSSARLSADRPAPRVVARAAMHAELSLAAYELVVERGFENVTLSDMAAAGGVSRSTFLRHFRTKDQAVAVALQTHASRMADVLRSRPVEEDDWTALRNAIEAFVIPIYSKDPAGALAVTRLIMFGPGLSAHLGSRDWHTPLAIALAERDGVGEPVPIRLRVKVAAALQCINLALSDWVAADGEVDLVDLLDEGFAALGAGPA